MIYNKLDEQNSQWAVNHKMRRAEYTKPVKGRRAKPHETEFERAVGNRTQGFPSKRVSEDKSKMTIGMDGQFKSARKSIAKPTKHASRLARKSECKSQDTLVLQERAKSIKKAERRVNRNNAARRNRNV